MTKQEVIDKLKEVKQQLNDGIMDSAGSKNSWKELKQVASDVSLDLSDLEYQIRRGE